MNLRSVILLTLAVLVPAGALAVLGFVLLGQQREMVRLRQQDRDLLTARQVADSLQARLDFAAGHAAAALQVTPHRLYPTPDSLLYLGRVQGGRFEPPYAPRRASSLESAAFKNWQIGYREMERRRAPLQERLRSLARTPQDSVQAAFLTFMKGRTLLAAGREAEARALLEPLARSSPGLTDEMGMPIAFYAVELLGPDQGGQKRHL